MHQPSRSAALCEYLDSSLLQGSHGLVEEAHQQHAASTRPRAGQGSLHVQPIAARIGRFATICAYVRARACLKFCTALYILDVMRSAISVATKSVAVTKVHICVHLLQQSHHVPEDTAPAGHCSSPGTACVPPGICCTVGIRLRWPPRTGRTGPSHRCPCPSWAPLPAAIPPFLPV